ncbi:MAG: hypothetical protein Ct9H300mP26_4850 [Acidimicrobiales bacterium]|nr:MAG: hypothetical protein Ct9H300mP26_4850 [Acidimicrobiales bacterium]
MRRLLSNEDGRRRLEPVIVELAPYGREYFVDPGPGLVDEGVLTMSMADQEQEWVKQVSGLLDEFDIPVDLNVEMPAFGRSGVRSKDFDLLHDEMTAVIRIDPKAQW